MRTNTVEQFYEDEIDALDTVVEREYYTVKEVGVMLGLGRDGVYAALERGDIPHKRLGRLVRIFKGPFDTWVKGD